MPPTSATDLASALLETAGTEIDLETVADLGPGLTYLIERPRGRIVYFNRPADSFPPAFFKLLESSPSWNDIVVESDRESYLRSSSAEEFLSEVSYQIHLNRRGETLPVCDYRRLVRNAAGEPVAILGRLIDDSFRSVAFDSLARRSWKEIATTMTRRYLHDFNNTIAGIYSLSELYAEPGSDPKSTSEAMGHIRDCSIRAQELTKKIRHLTTLETGPEDLHDLRRLLEEQTQYMEALLPKGAAIDLELPAGDHPIRLDANLFRQVILHLTGNASDACGETAQVAIRLYQNTERRATPLAIIEFKDNGPGFSSQHLDQAHAPFFTTKDKAKHPGLGLSIAKSFAQKLGGFLELANANPGAVVRICLPIAVENAAAIPAKSNLPAAIRATKPQATEPVLEEKPASTCVHIYTWEDISRHPLLAAMKNLGWTLHVHLDPGDLLIALVQPKEKASGILVFKNPLDERVDPLLSELSRARNCPKLALLSLGESPDAIPEGVKRNCGLVASGATKPSALIKQLAKFFG